MKNMMIYLRNVVRYKMDYFKGMTYDDICPIFEKKFNSNVAFLQKKKEQMDEEDSRALKRLSKTQEEKAAKKQKLDKEIITFTTTRLILLVERRYPLSSFGVDAAEDFKEKVNTLGLVFLKVWDDCGALVCVVLLLIRYIPGLSTFVLLTACLAVWGKVCAVTGFDKPSDTLVLGTDLVFERYLLSRESEKGAGLPKTYGFGIH
nr:hypothetical protein [Tanacetum cinerariifolium]